MTPRWDETTTYREDPLTGRPVIIAPERGRRPIQEPQATEFPPTDEPCPFCAGMEHETPPAVLTIPTDGDWRVRVVPNRYPALRHSMAPAEIESSELFRSQPGFGYHEVIIECPHHETQWTRFTIAHLTEVLDAYRARLRHYRNNHQIEHCLIFKNRGPGAGASLEHAHSQLLALPRIPPNVREKLQGAEKHYQAHQRCIWCDLLRWEHELQSRWVVHSDWYTALMPFASRFAFETWILPREHAARFEDSTDQELFALATFLRSLLAGLDHAAASPPFNLVLQTAPFQLDDDRHYHWHLEILPRLHQPAGFEWGGGIMINPIAPEEAARRLRDSLLRGLK